MDIEILKEYVKIKHEGQKRKQGTPYYLHPFAVADILKEKGFNDDYQAAGLLHDTLEDTNATKEEILKLSNKGVLDTVVLLTKEKGYKIKRGEPKERKKCYEEVQKVLGRVINTGNGARNEHDNHGGTE